VRPLRRVQLCSAPARLLKPRLRVNERTTGGTDDAHLNELERHLRRYICTFKVAFPGLRVLPLRRECLSSRQILFSLLAPF
jgi:hypothetical protein